MPDEPGITTPGEDLELASVHVDAGGDAPGSRSAQLKRLAEVAAAVSREPTLEGLLRTVTEGAREMVGAHQAVTSRLVRGWTEAITHVSLSDKYAAWRGYEQVPKGLGVLNAVTRTNRPIRLTPQELVRHPDYRALRDAPDHPPLPNYLAAPLVSRRGQNLGLIQLSDKATVDGAVGDFDADDEALIVTLAQLASAAIENLELVERERAAGERVDATARSLKLLSDAGEALAENLDLDATVRTVASLAVPLLGDWCGVHLAPGDDDATADADGAPPRLAAQAATDPQVGQVVARAAGALDVAAVLHQRGPRTFDRLPATMLADVERALPDRALGPG
ncbi:MAG TPA: GAF domain-containing protein, partial [Solirubrobacteraceae bacterium]